MKKLILLVTALFIITTSYAQDSYDLPMLSDHKILGATYNIFGDYPDRENNGSIIKDGNLILPLLYDSNSYDDSIEVGPTSSGESLHYLYPSDLINVTIINSTEDISEAEESITKMQKSLSSKVTVKGRYNSFSGSMSASYSGAISEEEEQYYSMLQQTYEGYLVKLTNFDDLNNYEDSFKDDLLNKEPLDLFEKYGTHIVTGIVAGLAARYESFASKKNFESTQDFSIAAKAKYNDLVKGGSFSAEGKYSDSKYQDKVSSSTSAYAIGGNQPVDLTSSSDVNRWKSSFWDDSRYQAFTEIMNEGLQPIWNILDEEYQDRKDELSDAFDDLYTLYNDGDKKEVIKGNSDLETYQCEAYVKLFKEYEVPIGYGINTNSKNKVNRMVIKVHNTMTDEIKFNEYNDGKLTTVSNRDKYDHYLEIPIGYALTGIGLGASKDSDDNTKINKLKLWYQQIDYTKSSQGFLGETIYKITSGGGSEDKSYTTTSGNSDILTEVGVSVDNDGKIKSMVIEHAKMKMNADPNDL